MPFDVQCDGCGRKFRAPDKLAGKRVKCPQCQAVLLVGAAPSTASRAQQPEKSQAKSKPAVSDSSAGKKKIPVARPVDEAQPVAPQEPEEWHMQTGDGQEFGPVTKSELESWVQEGRLDSNCQVLQDGWDQWKWADEVFPQLAAPPVAPPPEPANPFAGIGEPATPAEVNPFVSPVATTVAPTAVPVGEQSAITPRIRRALADTKPWVTFLAILGLIAGGLFALALLGEMAVAIMTRIPTLIVMSLLAAIGPALYVIAAYYLLTYGNRIGGFLRTGAVRELEDAMVAQKSFWKLIGIVTAVVLAIYVLTFVLAISMGVFAGHALRPH